MSEYMDKLENEFTPKQFSEDTKKIVIFAAIAVVAVMAIAATKGIFVEIESTKQIQSLSEQATPFCDDHPNGVIVTPYMIVTCDTTTANGKHVLKN